MWQCAQKPVIYYYSVSAGQLHSFTFTISIYTCSSWLFELYDICGILQNFNCCEVSTKYPSSTYENSNVAESINIDTIVVKYEKLLIVLLLFSSDLLLFRLNHQQLSQWACDQFCFSYSFELFILAIHLFSDLFQWCWIESRPWNYH